MVGAVAQLGGKRVDERGVNEPGHGSKVYRTAGFSRENRPRVGGRGGGPQQGEVGSGAVRLGGSVFELRHGVEVESEVSVTIEVETEATPAASREPFDSFLKAKPG